MVEFAGNQWVGAVDGIYFAWSILHLLVRVTVTVNTTSSVHKAAVHAPLAFIQDRVANKDYSLEVVKADDRHT